MFNNVAFEIVIGLVFIYLLYSLLVTILGEIISTKLGIRSRLLRIAIERMLNDGYYENVEKKTGKQWQGWLRKIFLYEPDEFKNSVAGQFYEYPAIKYLGRIEDAQKSLFSSTKPSYISAEYFADALTNFLADKGEGITQMDKVAFCLKFNTCNIQPKTLKQLINLLETAGASIETYKQLLIKWFNETMDRSNGWYKREMRAMLFCLGLLIALAFNIDSIRIAKLLAIDKDARSQLVSMGVELAHDPLRYNDIIVGDGDSQFTRNVIDTGFSRVTKDINAANLVLGLGWEFENLSKKGSQDFTKADDASKFNALKSWLPRYKNLQDSIKDLLMEREDRLKTIADKRDSLKLLALDTLIKSQQLSHLNNVPGLDADLSKMLDLLGSIQKSIYALEIQNRNDSISYLANEILLKDFRASINKIAEMDFLNIVTVDTTIDGNKIFISGTRKYSGIEKFCEFLKIVFLEWGWLGILITALALCVGAPFWFDMLIRLVAIRGAGVKPEEKKDKTNPLPITPVNQTASLPLVKQTKTTPIQAAINKLTDKYHGNNKILSIEDGYIRRNNVKEEAIEIHVKDRGARDALTNEIGTEYEGFLINYMVNTNTVTLSSSGGDSVFNETGINGAGTIGCVLQNVNTQQRYLLSCWHVLKGNTIFSDNSGSGIIKSKDKEIARLAAGCLSFNLDIGFAELNNGFTIDNNALNIRRKWRQVLKNDAKIETEVYFAGAFSGFRGVKPDDKVVIYNHIVTKEIEYPDKTTKELQDLFSITRYVNQIPTSPSSEGDSGALIIDNNGSPLGIIIGGNSNFSYGVKLSNAFTKGALYHQFSNII